MATYAVTGSGGAVSPGSALIIAYEITGGTTMVLLVGTGGGVVRGGASFYFVQSYSVTGSGGGVGQGGATFDVDWSYTCIPSGGAEGQGTAVILRGAVVGVSGKGVGQGTASILFSAASAVSTIGENGTVLSVNIENLARTNYLNLFFDSFASVNGAYYGTVKGSGIYKLTGDNDNGADISPSLQTGMTKFGSEKSKNVPFLYITCDTDGIIGVRGIIDNENQTSERLGPADSVGIRARKQKLPLGIRSKLWGSLIRFIGASKVVIESIELLPEDTDRRT